MKKTSVICSVFAALAFSPFAGAQNSPFQDAVEAAVGEVLDSGQYGTPGEYGTPRDEFVQPVSLPLRHNGFAFFSTYPMFLGMDEYWAERTHGLYVALGNPEALQEYLLWMARHELTHGLHALYSGECLTFDPEGEDIPGGCEHAFKCLHLSMFIEQHGDACTEAQQQLGVVESLLTLAALCDSGQGGTEEECLAVEEQLDAARSRLDGICAAAKYMEDQLAAGEDTAYEECPSVDPTCFEEGCGPTNIPPPPPSGSGPLVTPCGACA